MLVLIEHGASVDENLMLCQDLLQQASTDLQILDPEHGEQDLVKSVAAETAKVTALIAENSQRQYRGTSGTLRLERRWVGLSLGEEEEGGGGSPAYD